MLQVQPGSEDATLLHLALSHFVSHPHPPTPLVGPNRRASWWETNAEVFASWKQLGSFPDRIRAGRRSNPASRWEKRVYEAGWLRGDDRSDIGRRRSLRLQEIGGDFQTLGRCCVLVRH